MAIRLTRAISDVRDEYDITESYYPLSRAINRDGWGSQADFLDDWLFGLLNFVRARMIWQ